MYSGKNSNTNTALHQMIVLGIDPATLSAALAVAKDGELLQTHLWKGNSKDSQFRRLASWQELVKYKIEVVSPNLVVIAESSFQRNMETVRALARAEAVAIVASVTAEVPVVTAKDTQIRSILWPDEKVTKEMVYPRMKKKYPKIATKWERIDKGGQDQADAAAAALAGPVILERKLK